MTGGTLGSTNNDGSQRLAPMDSNHTRCIGMESKVEKNESPKDLYVRNQD